MEKKYKVKVNDSYEFEFSQEEIEALDSREVSPLNYHILKENKSLKAHILKQDFFRREYTVKLNSEAYTVKVSNELDLLIDEMGLSLGTSQAANTIKAPMPGLILDVSVKEGDEVKAGDYLLVLEAMKMENSLTAPKDGIIKTVTVKVGETVDKNQLLIEME
ncbi:acetyl-CoA carboxylase biotin carboxyl carrier protein subunit [Salinimicrobium sp. GXAS 041]|uniref:acetyl-CoA carboxylase biotin carboxyl carrier protein subunit n=1 Tax=Salinimicrobium sp. GXAS 041 TaxID=3400806 RepID=UPI003C75E5E0